MKLQGYLILFVTLFVSFTSCVSTCSPSQESPLLEVFLNKLDSVDYYIQIKEESIDVIKQCPAFKGGDCLDKYEAYMDVARAYGQYVGDSSVVYLDKAIKVADSINNKQLKNIAILEKANTFILLGHFVDAEDLLEDVRISGMDDEVKRIYYRVSYQQYYALRFNSFNDEYYEYYDAFCNSYRDSILMNENPRSSYYLRTLEKKFAYDGEYDKSYKINQVRMYQVEDAKEEALVSYDRFILKTKYMGKPIEECIDDLLISSIADIESANQDVASFLTLEKYLISVGKVDSAKDLSDYYFSTMKRYGSRLRRIHGFDYAMGVNEEFANLLARRQIQITLALVFISVLLFLAIILLSVLLSVQKKVMNLNASLEISNAVSKRYVLGFFQLYSDYIERLLHFRAKINTNIRRGNSNYVLELTNPDKDVNEEELKQLYKNFDAAFLDIYPDYVTSFNELLKPEFRYTNLAKDELSMELRVFALVKLGEKDSSTISKLLHCSIKTVYNKRSEIKKKLISPVKDFEKIISKL